MRARTHGQVVREEEGPLERSRLGRGSPPSICRCIQSHPQLGGSQSGARYVKWLLRKVVWRASTHCRGNQSAEHFDRLKVTLKRGEIDWLHIVLEIYNHCVVTRCAKLCRVAMRRQTWWSVESIWTQPIASRSRGCAQPTTFIASMQRRPECLDQCGRMEVRE